MDKSRISMGPVPPGQDSNVPQSVTPEYPTLIVMIAVLAIIVLFCFWGAPGIKDFCRKNVCCLCPFAESRVEERSVEVREEEDHDFVVVTNIDGKNGQVHQTNTQDRQPQP